MAFRALGAATLFGGSLLGYRQYRINAVLKEKNDDPTKMNAKEKFEHFSTGGEGSVMSTEDFVQSMVAGSGGCQQEEEHHSPHKRDGKSSRGAKVESSGGTYKSLSEVFKKMDANQDNVLNYSEYCMFLTLVSTSKEHFRMAFKMFDMNGNQKIDLDDFKKMMSALVVDPTVKLTYKGGVCEQFFGRDYKKEITMDAFSNLVDELRREVRTAEFRSVSESGSNSSSSSISFPKLQSLFGLDSGNAIPAAAAGNRRCTLTQYHNLVDVLLRADTIQRAMKIFTQGRGDAEPQGVEKPDFIRALRAADVKLSTDEVNLFFDLFDSDHSGSIDATEFAAVTRRKRSFFAAHQPRYDQPQRNAIQQWAYCMQQRE